MDGFGPTTPDQAAAYRDGTLELRRLAACATVEEHLRRAYEKPAASGFRVGFAPPPLGGCEAWLEEDLVSYICDEYALAGWSVSVEPPFVVFAVAC